MEIASAMHRALVGKVGHERYAVWFGRGVRMEPCGKTLRIAAADTFRRDYLRRTFRADLIEAARIASQLLEIKLEEVEFVVDPSVDVPRSEVGDQRSEVGERKSDVRGQRSAGEIEVAPAANNSPTLPLFSSSSSPSKPPIPR